jgi:DNA-directed RNA polymerase specialized sigma24 family protein
LISLTKDELAALVCSPCRLRTLTDAELMNALRSGCNDALATLFERHSALVFQTARGSLCSDGEAEATVRRVFGDVFQAKDEFNSDRDSFTSWLLKQAEIGPGRSLA